MVSNDVSALASKQPPSNHQATTKQPLAINPQMSVEKLKAKQRELDKETSLSYQKTRFSRRQTLQLQLI